MNEEAGRGGRGAGRGRGAGKGDGPVLGLGITEVEVVLYNLEFPEPVVEHMVNQEGLRNLHDFLLAQKEVIDSVFTRLYNLQIQYSAAIHLSLIK